MADAAAEEKEYIAAMNADRAPPATPAPPPPAKKVRAPSEFLAAIAVAGIAFYAPAEDTGFVLRLIGSVIALACLLLAEIGLESFLKARATASAPRRMPSRLSPSGSTCRPRRRAASLPPRAI